MINNKRNVKFLTVLAVTVLFVLIIVLVTVLVQKSQLEFQKRQLQEQIAYYQQLKTEKENELELRNTYEWLEQRARELGLLGADESLFGAE